MTRPLEDVLRVLELFAEGHSKKEISRRTRVSRASIREWVADPDRALGRSAARGSGHGVCDGGCGIETTIDRGAYAYLLGMYLGDGYIARHPKAYKLRISCDQSYPLIMAEVAAAIRRLLPVKTGRVRSIGCDDVYAYSRHWTCLFPQHGPGRKHERSILLEDWQLEIVRQFPKRFLKGLLHSDGCRVVNRVKRPVAGAIKEYRYLRYFFSNASEDILQLFCDTCDLLGVRYRRDGPRNVTINHQSDIAFVDTFVGPKR